MSVQELVSRMMSAVDGVPANDKTYGFAHFKRLEMCPTLLSRAALAADATENSLALLQVLYRRRRGHLAEEK